MGTLGRKKIKDWMRDKGWQQGQQAYAWGTGRHAHAGNTTTQPVFRMKLALPLINQNKP